MKKASKIITTIIYWLISLAIVAVVLCREMIFDSSTIIYNMFNEEVKNQVVVKILKTVFIFDIGIIVIHIARYIRELQKVFESIFCTPSGMTIDDKPVQP